MYSMPLLYGRNESDKEIKKMISSCALTYAEIPEAVIG
jgi:hypothetical protein